VPLTSDRDIARVLATTRTIAVVGASANAERPSHRVLEFLLLAGYEIYPVNPGLAGGEICGLPVYASLADVPVQIDMVDVFRQPHFLAEIVNQAIDIGAGAIWCQLGVVDEQAAALAEAAGLDVVMDRCPAIELPKLWAAGLLERPQAMGKRTAPLP